jgi:hypothetical protein
MEQKGYMTKLPTFQESKPWNYNKRTGVEKYKARSPWHLKIFTWHLNFKIYLSLIHGFLSLYLQNNMLAPEKKGLASELFLVLSPPVRE